MILLRLLLAVLFWHLFIGGRRESINMELISVYITTTSADESTKIARRLLEERLIACANICKSVDSMYWWGNEIQESQESLLIVKSQVKDYALIEEVVKEEHSYECPCILVFPIGDGNDDYLTWVRKETNRPRS